MMVAIQFFNYVIPGLLLRYLVLKIYCGASSFFGVFPIRQTSRDNWICPSIVDLESTAIARRRSVFGQLLFASHRRFKLAPVKVSSFFKTTPSRANVFDRRARWKPILVALTVCLSACPSRAGPTNNVMLHDICTQNPYGLKRYFLDEGENGTIIAKNLDYERIVSLSARAYYSSFYPQPGSNSNNRVCSVELTTCPSCSIQMQFKILNLPPCETNANSNATSGSSRCR